MGINIKEQYHSFTPVQEDEIPTTLIHGARSRLIYCPQIPYLRGKRDERCCIHAKKIKLRCQKIDGATSTWEQARRRLIA